MHPDISTTYENYKLALRSSLKKPQIFLRRKFSDRLLNAYNSDILRLHRANMDIQFILDAYACCSYIINYINKSNRGVSQLLRQAMDEINDGNFTIKQNYSTLAINLLTDRRCPPKKRLIIFWASIFQKPAKEKFLLIRRTQTSESEW